LENPEILWPFLIYATLALFIVISMLGFSYVLGQRHRDHSTDEIFESGIASTGSANLRFSAQFYLVAMFFVIFDLEVVFIVAWAIAFRELGWTGYIAAAVFIGILVVVLLYEWRTGALDFAASGKRILRRKSASGRGREPS
jgi:NADH-quinone oxidoreductase subunit A